MITRGLNAMIESLTPSEAAVVAGVSVRDVHRMIDEHILPEALYTATQVRSFKSEGLRLHFLLLSRGQPADRGRTTTDHYACKRIDPGISDHSG